MTALHELPDGARLAYDDEGTGRPVILIHGMSMSRRYFERNVAPLAERFRVLAVDLRSHGDSPRSEGGNTVAQHARDVRHLIETLDLERPVLVGWSMGSMVAWDMIRQFGGDGLGGHVVVSQGPSDLARDDWGLGAFTLDELFGLVDGAQADYAAVLDEVISLMFKDEITPADRAWMLAESCKVGANAGALTILNQSLQDYRDVVGAHDVPTLLTWGRDEKLISVATGEWVAAHQPAQLVMFEESGHCPMWEEADRFNQVVGDWVAGLPRMDDAALRDEATGLARDLIRVDTSNPPGREGPAARVLVDYLSSNGVEVELVANDPERPNVVARIRGTGEGPSLALCGHTDVVPAHAADWAHPPFGGHVDDDGWLWGRGAVDMKNQTATRAVVLALLAREGFRPRGDLLFIGQSDEEDGVADVGMSWLVKARPDLRVDFALDEGGGDRLVLDDGRVLLTIECGQKAVLGVAITALGEAGHASKPYVAANAVPRLATLVARIAAYTPDRRLLEPVREMIDLVAGPLTGDLATDVARACAAHPWVATTLPALLGATMAPTRLEGSSARNVMPARATAEIDCRILPGGTPAELERELRTALGDDLPYDLRWLEEPTGGALSPTGSPLYLACQAWADVADPGATLLPVLSTGFADSNYLREAWGTVAYGFWPYRTTPIDVHDRGFHNRDERIHTDDLVYATRAHLDIVRRLLGDRSA